MPKMKKQSQKLVSSNKFVYATLLIVAALIIAVLMFTFYPQQSQPKAAIIDQLSSSKLSQVSRYPNQTFIAEAEELLHTRFLEVDYYSNNATVDNYRALSSSGYKLIIWRAHSALDLESKYIAISTSERNGSKSYDQYSNEQLTLCTITGDPQSYFAITPKFVEECMDGRFEDTVIILMSCNGLRNEYDKTAEAFIQKGAKAFISWDGWIDSSDNDYAITLLLQNLIIQNGTIGEAVAEAPDYAYPLYPQVGPSRLDYYPHTDVGSYHIPNYKQDITTTAAAFALAPIRKKIRNKLVESQMSFRRWLH
jgi:hypothetical protein